MTMWPFGGGDEQQPAQGSQDRVEPGPPRRNYSLKGAFPGGGSYTVLGPPGGGKTILGNQFCFNHVAGDGEGHCVYLSLLVASGRSMCRTASTTSAATPRCAPAGRTRCCGRCARRCGSEG